MAEITIAPLLSAPIRTSSALIGTVQPKRKSVGRLSIKSNARHSKAGRWRNYRTCRPDMVPLRPKALPVRPGRGPHPIQRTEFRRRSHVQAPSPAWRVLHFPWQKLSRRQHHATAAGSQRTLEDRTHLSSLQKDTFLIRHLAKAAFPRCWRAAPSVHPSRESPATAPTRHPPDRLSTFNTLRGTVRFSKFSRGTRLANQTAVD